jgi:hypothetical protein
MDSPAEMQPPDGVAPISRRHALALLAALSLPPRARGQSEIIDVRKVWDRAPHNAFTDLIRFRDAWFCAFREGSSHVATDGVLRILTSADGRDWTSAALLKSSTVDLRDPKLSIAPDGRLLLLGAAVTRAEGETTHRSRIWSSDDGRRWDDGREVGDENVWLWRLTWHEGAAYGVGYDTLRGRFARLYKGNGSRFDPLVPTLFAEGHPTEAALTFLTDNSAVCLLRRDGKGPDRTAQLGRSRPPYTEWTWRDLGVPVGGPALLRLHDGRLVAGVRLYDGKVRTALCWLDADAGRLTEFATLTSGGDTSYPGLVWRDGRIWVSYYSSHEGKASIYLAKVKPPAH